MSDQSIPKWKTNPFQRGVKILETAKLLCELIDLEQADIMAAVNYSAHLEGNALMNNPDVQAEFEAEWKSELARVSSLRTLSNYIKNTFFISDKATKTNGNGEPF